MINDARRSPRTFMRSLLGTPGRTASPYIPRLPSEWPERSGSIDTTVVSKSEWGGRTYFPTNDPRRRVNRPSNNEAPRATAPISTPTVPGRVLDALATLNTQLSLLTPVNQEKPLYRIILDILFGTDGSENRQSLLDAVFMDLSDCNIKDTILTKEALSSLISTLYTAINTAMSADYSQYAGRSRAVRRGEWFNEFKAFLNIASGGWKQSIGGNGAKQVCVSLRAVWTTELGPIILGEFINKNM